MWEITRTNKISVIMDVSTYCNAKCPQCHRTDKTGLTKIQTLPLVQWSLEQFKQAITPADFDYIRRVDFIGSWGDCIMNQDIFEIVKYCILNFCQVNVETNGSIRNEEWWWDFGVMGGKLLTVKFDVDGVDQTMHEKYRRSTNLQQVLNNMYSFSQTQATAATQTVVFKHNQDSIEQIAQLCYKHGSQWHTNVISDRFINDSKVFIFTNDLGKTEILEEADRNVLPNSFISGITSDKLSSCITCRWGGINNKILVDYRGQVFPCCFHGTGYLLPNNDHYFINNPLFAEYKLSEEQYNIFYNSIYDIMNSSFFKDKLPSSMKSSIPQKLCLSHCSSKIKNHHQQRNISFLDSVKES